MQFATDIDSGISKRDERLGECKMILSTRNIRRLKVWKPCAFCEAPVTENAVRVVGKLWGIQMIYYHKHCHNLYKLGYTPETIQP